MRRLPVICAALVAALGVGAAVAVADTTTSTATQCATTVSGTHTSALVVDGVTQSTKTTGGDSLSVCATATATATNATVTTTVPGPTTTVTTTVGTTTSPPPPSYLFDDEFNGAAGSTPSSTLWGAKTSTAGNGSAHWNGWNQVSEDGSGNLVITAQKIGGTWQSAFLSGTTAFGSGAPYHIEARAKLACGAGMWNAPVWTWEAPYGAAPGFENDVNEALTGKDAAGQYHATLHNWNGGTNPQSGDLLSTGSSTLCTAFHTYGADVYGDHVDYFFDGSLVDTITAAQISATNLDSYSQVANIDLNMGGWGGTIGSETSATMTVDYIRVSALTAGSPSFASATAYTATHPAFTPTRTVNVSDAASFKTALTNLQAGDLVQATAPFTVTGETTLSKQLSGHAELDLQGVSFVYSGGANLPAVYLNDPSNLYIYGGDLSTADTGGTCMLFHGAQQVLWWGFKTHDCGGSGVAAIPVGGAIDHVDLEGEVTKVGQNLNYDPHCAQGECGTGEHGALLWDSDTTDAFTNSRFAFDAHDIPVGACVEIGNGAVATAAGGNTLILRCANETDVAVKQAGGNGLELWGDTSNLGLDVPYLEVTNAQGRALDGQQSSGQSLSGVTVDYGRASNTNQNGALNEASPSLPWYPHAGPTYGDVQPIP